MIRKNKPTMIYECVCPLCGKLGTNIDDSLYAPEFYCEDCNIWYQYIIQYKIFSEDYYKIDKWEKAKFCKKHKKVYEREDDDKENCKCDMCISDKHKSKFKKMFTKEQKEFLRQFNSWDLKVLIIENEK